MNSTMQNNSQEKSFRGFIIRFVCHQQYWPNMQDVFPCQNINLNLNLELQNWISIQNLFGGR